MCVGVVEDPDVLPALPARVDAVLAFDEHAPAGPQNPLRFGYGFLIKAKHIIGGAEGCRGVEVVGLGEGLFDGGFGVVGVGGVQNHDVEGLVAVGEVAAVCSVGDVRRNKLEPRGVRLFPEVPFAVGDVGDSVAVVDV